MTSYVTTSFSTKWLITKKLEGDIIDFFGHFVVIKPNFDILSSLNRFYIFSSCSFITFYPSYMAGYPIFSHWFCHLCVIINFSAKNIKILCLRSIQ